MPDFTYNGYPAVVLEALRAHDSDEATPALMGCFAPKSDKNAINVEDWHSTMATVIVLNLKPIALCADTDCLGAIHITDMP